MENIDENELIKFWKKKHGWSKKPDILQVLSYFLILNLTFGFIFFVLPFFDKLQYKLFGSFLYFGSLIFLGIYTWKCTLTDLTEENTKKAAYFKSKGITYDIDSLDFQCLKCQSPVKEDTKHCQACNRCVKNFDHHCRWINNCIGKENYHLFIKMTVAGFIYSFISLSENIVSLSLSFQKRNLNFFGKKKGQLNKIAKACLIINTLVSLLLALMSLNLLLFHRWLKQKKISTYQYLMEKRRNKVKRKKTKGKAKKESNEPLRISKLKKNLEPMPLLDVTEQIRKSKESKSHKNSTQLEYQDIIEKDARGDGQKLPQIIAVKINRKEKRKPMKIIYHP